MKAASRGIPSGYSYTIPLNQQTFRVPGFGLSRDRSFSSSSPGCRLCVKSAQTSDNRPKAFSRFVSGPTDPFSRVDDLVYVGFSGEAGLAADAILLRNLRPGDNWMIYGEMFVKDAGAMCVVVPWARAFLGRTTSRPVRI